MCAVIKELDLNARKGREKLLEYLRSEEYDKLYFSVRPPLHSLSSLRLLLHLLLPYRFLPRSFSDALLLHSFILCLSLCVASRKWESRRRAISSRRRTPSTETTTTTTGLLLFLFFASFVLLYFYLEL